MPRKKPDTVESTTAPRQVANPAAAPSPSPAADSEPRDWSELGRRVLAEALRRTRDEFARRHATRPTSVVPQSNPEN